MVKIRRINNKIAFISDLHNNKEFLKKILPWIKNKDVDAIILGGDIPGHTTSSFLSILKQFLKLNKPIIIFPGSHENQSIYKETLAKIKPFDKKKLLIDGVRNRLIDYKGWEFIIIPGSKVVSSGPGKWFGGSYWLFENKITSSMKRRAEKKLREIGFSKKESLVSIYDTVKAIEKKSKVSGSKKILFSHEPLKNKTSNGLDLAVFGKIIKNFKIDKKHFSSREIKKLFEKFLDRTFEKDQVLTLEKTNALQKYSYPVKITKKHVGDEAINKFLKKQKITKMVCGHIHECSFRAIDFSEKKIKPNIFHKEALINSGLNNVTIISFENKSYKNKVSFEFYEE